MTGREGCRLERRRLLGLVGTGAFVAGAGCISEFGTGDESGNGDEDESDERTFEPSIEHPGDGPIEFSRDQNCAVCNMTPTDYPRWQSQLAHENGEGAVFDTPGCMFAYVAATASDSPVAGAWTTGFGTRDLIDATEAHYVLVTDADAAADDPMDINPRAFADAEDAVAYLDEWDAEELTEDDIVGFEDIDRETAAIYRGNRL